MQREGKFGGQIQEWREQYGLTAENSVLEEVLNGLNDATTWILQRYNVENPPTIAIGEHTGAFKNANGYGIADNGEIVIALHINELRTLDGEVSPESVTLYSDHAADIPRKVEPVLTVKQRFEAFAIEEMIHWLQDVGTEGLVKLPPREKIMLPAENTLRINYHLQPHEFEAIQICGVYFTEKYGHNPYQALEEFLESKRS
jgi:hypothetical protein